MSQPPSPYERSYSFTDNSTANPTSQQPGQKIDQELNAARTAINATISRLGEVQADDGKVRTSALNLPSIAQAVEPLLTTAPVQAVNSAGATQVAAVNAAGTTQVTAVNAAAASGVASINAAIANPMVTTVLVAEQQAVAAAASAQSDAANSLINRNLTYNLYVQTNSALSATQNAAMTAAADAASAANHSSSAGNSAGIATSEASAANQAQILAEAHMMAALDAKAQAEAAASTAQNIVNNGAAAIATEVQPYLDAAELSATNAHNSANDALTYKTQAATSATNASNSASSAATSASNASSSASSAAASATAAANSAAAINPAAYAPAVHTHAVGDITGLSGALTGYATLNGSTFTGKVSVPAASAGGAGFRIIGSSTNPTSAVAGDIWYNNSTQRLLHCVSPSVAWNIATENWVAGQSFVTPGYLSSNSYLKFGDQGTQAWWYASKKDWSASAPTAIIVGGYGNGYQYEGTATLTSAAYDGWTLNFNGSFGGGYSYYSDSGSKTHYITYDTSFDLSNNISGISGLGIPGFSFSYSDDTFGPYYSSLSGLTLAYPTILVSNSDRFIFDLYDRQIELARAASAPASSVQVYDGVTGMYWAKPWENYGYVTSGALSSYVLSSTYTSGLALKANIASPTFTGVVVTAASSTTAAGFRLPHGAAPTTPTNGDVWSTTTGLFLRQNGTTKQFVDFDSAQTITGNKTFSSSSLTLGNSTATGTIAIGTGAVGSTVNKFVNIGTGGLTGSATMVVIGTSSGGTNSHTINGSTTFSAGSKVTVTHNATQAGLNVGPVASGITTPANGDVFHNSTAGVQQIIGMANGIQGCMTACRAFVNFNGTGTVAMRSNFNVSSITDNGVGDYTVNFTNAMVDTNYAVVGGNSGTRSVCFNIAVTTDGAAATSKTTTAVRMHSGGSGAYGDQTEMSVAIFR